MLSILPLSLPPPPYDQNDNGSDKPAKQENYPNSDQKHLVAQIVVKGKIQGGKIAPSVEYIRIQEDDCAQKNKKHLDLGLHLLNIHLV